MLKRTSHATSVARVFKGLIHWYGGITHTMFISRLLAFLSLFLLVSAERIVRFVSTDGKEYYGDAILPANTTDAAKSTTARVIQGDVLGDFTVTKEVKVRKHRPYREASDIELSC